MVRRLPVVQTEDSDDAAAARRPRWQWISIGALIAFVLWMPLLMVATWVRAVWVRQLVGGADSAAVAKFGEGAGFLDHLSLVAATLLPILGSLGAACAAGGALVGRFGGKAGSREGAESGLLVSVTAWGIGAAAGVFPEWLMAAASLVVLGGTGAWSGYLGARAGKKRRPSAP